VDKKVEIMSGGHFLVVESDGDFDIEHPVDCPTITIYEGVQDWDCGIGQVTWNEGFESLGIEDLAPGRYEIEYWYETYRNRFRDEFECGIRFVEAEGAH
jgi:hypothetical protein